MLALHYGRSPCHRYHSNPGYLKNRTSKRQAGFFKVFYGLPRASIVREEGPVCHYGYDVPYCGIYGALNSNVFNIQVASPGGIYIAKGNIIKDSINIEATYFYRNRTEVFVLSGVKE